MKDRVVQYPNRFNLVDPATGSILQTVNIVPNPGVVSAEGDDLNKANLLPDDVATALGLTGNPQVKDALLQLLNIANEKAVIEFTSYVGTGVYGPTNPTSVTFSFAPKFVWIHGSKSETGNYTRLSPHNVSISGSNYSTFTWLDPRVLTTEYTKNAYLGIAYGNNRYMKKSADGKTLYWHIDTGADRQFNEAGTTYYCLAIA